MKPPAFSLSTHNWQQIQDLLNEALARPPEVRTAFLRQACGQEPALYAEVESLLAAYLEAGGFLEALDTTGAAALMAGPEEPELAGSVSPYRLLHPLGRGGMGIVYLAQDTRLNRPVALKFLPPHLATDPVAVRRLFAEAQAAAALDHPHIAVVHEIGTTEPGPGAPAGRHYIAMAYYEGETLQERIRRGPLPVEEARRLLRQIAEGLRAAHQQGIVHRDIKPSNIIVTPDGNAKIVDFGIARITGAEITRTGATLGTVAYMSPEQTRGGAVDPRTDLWSLGVVLQEMLTGTRPFRGDHGETLIHAIRHDPPVPISTERPDVPDGLVQVVERCLAKDPAQRYPDADALLHHLETGAGTPRQALRRHRRRRLAATLALLTLGLLVALVFGLRLGAAGEEGAVTASSSGAPSGVIRMAVLPLENISPAAADAYWAAGMTEELIVRLSKLSGLQVIGRTSVRRYADSEAGIREIGAGLNVVALLGGSVRTSGETVRLALHLTDAETEALLWSQEYDARGREVLAVQQEVAERVAEALHVQLQAGEPERLARHGTVDPEAYVHYLKGRYYIDTYQEASVLQGRDALQQAIDLDPTFAEAWAGLADAYKVLDYLSVMTPEEAGPRIRAAAERALALDPTLAEAHAALAVVLTDFHHDWETAGHHFQRAVSLDPGSGASLSWYAEYLRDQGRFGEALERIDQAQAADPLSAFYQMVEGIIYHMARRPEEALAHYEQLLTMHPNYRAVHLYIGLTKAELGRHEEVLAEMDRADPERFLPDALGIRGSTLANMGRRAEAEAVLGELEAVSAVRYVSPFHEALVRMHLGEQDRALDLLEQTVEERSWFVRLYRVAPELDPVRRHPRFSVLLERVGLGS